MKKFFSTVFAGLLLLGLLPPSSLTAFAASESDLTFESVSGGYKVSDCNPAVSGALVIPSEHKGKPVTEIGDFAFDSCAELTSVTMPESIKTIGLGAFSYCKKLANITFPESVKVIGGGALMGCTGLLSVKFPQNADINLMSFFKDCSSLKNVEIPKTCTLDSSINFYVFEGCTSLETVSVPSLSVGIEMFYNCTSLKTIECDNLTSDGSGARPPDYAFYNCEKLASVDLSAFEYSICDYMFYNCKSLKSVTIPEGVKYICDHAFSGCSGLETVLIPNTVESIGGYAFSDCTALSVLSVPDSVKTLESGALYNCTGLVGLNLGSGIEKISASDLGCCVSLEQINVSSGNNALSSQDGVLFNKDKTVLLRYPANKSGEYTVPNSVKYIGNNAFSYTKRLEKIELPEGLTTIGRAAFYDSLIKTVILPRSLNDIGDASFVGSDVSDVYFAGSEAEWGKITNLAKSKVYNAANIHFNYVKDKTPPQIKITVSNSFSTEQTVTAELSDDVGIAGYYWGTNESCSADSYYKSGGGTVILSVDSPGKYYLSAVDSSGNVSKAESVEFVKLSFDLCGGNADYSYAVVKKGNSLKPLAPAKKGCVFKGWTQNSGVSSGSVNITADKTTTYYAVWEKDTTFAYGDLNGDGKITAIDLALLRKYLANVNPATGESSVNVGKGADANGDGKITAIDLALLRKYLANVDPATGKSTVTLGPKK